MVQELTRRFKMGSAMLNDPAPHLPVDEAIKLYATQFPLINNCTLVERGQEGDYFIYEIEKPPVKTKGTSD